MNVLYYHACSREDHPLIFRNETEFRVGMNLLALSARMYPSAVIIAFELMSNHFHILVFGHEDTVTEMIDDYIKLLAKYYKSENWEVDFSNLRYKLFAVETEEYLRNVIAYINRNASFASPQVTPFNYEWGTGRFFFNPESIKRYDALRKPLTELQKRQMSHSRKFDETDGLYELDGYISPLSFCDIIKSESFFRSPRQYMYYVAKSVEATKDIAKEIGESITFSDYDLYGIVSALSKNMFGKTDSRVLTSDEKMQICKVLHYEYNAGNKQICRLLKIGMEVVNMLFPGCE